MQKCFPGVTRFGEAMRLRAAAVRTLQRAPGKSEQVIFDRSGVLHRPKIKELPLAEAARTHKEILEPGSAGKIVLICDRRAA
jgi:hypothetical protein